MQRSFGGGLEERDRAAAMSQPHLSSAPSTAKLQSFKASKLRSCSKEKRLTAAVCMFPPGAEPAARPGPRLPHHRQALRKRPASVLSPGGNELSVLQPLHLRLAAQQGALPPQGLPLSRLPRGDRGESIVQELTASGQRAQPYPKVSSKPPPHPPNPHPHPQPMFF